MHEYRVCQLWKRTCYWQPSRDAAILFGGPISVASCQYLTFSSHPP